MESCPLLSRVGGDDDQDEATDEDKDRYTYAALGGVVPFTADDMKNSETWKYRSDLRSLRYSPVASHVCSYLCFTAPVSRLLTSPFLLATGSMCFVHVDV